MNDPIDGAVARQIRKRRKALRLTQKQMGERLGVTFQQIQKYERGESGIRAGRLYRIAKMLHCSTNDLYSDLPNESDG